MSTEDNTVTETEEAPKTDNHTESFAISEAEWAQLKAALDKRYAEIAGLLRYNKTKEEAIQKLSKEVEKYREDFAYSALKPFINALISLREDCNKSIRDVEKYKYDPVKAVDEAKAKKYLGILVSDIEEMLLNLGLERNDGVITINGKPLLQDTKPVKKPEELSLAEREQHDKEYAEIVMNTGEINNAQDLIEYLKKNEDAIRTALADRSVVDKTIMDYIAIAARTDAVHYFALASPIARDLFTFQDKLSELAKAMDKYSGDQAVKFYVEYTKKVAMYSGKLLSNAGVRIETSEGVFDGQKHRVLKTIPTNDEMLDKTIANTYSDCYIYGNDVIYQSKVDVYKLQSN